MDLEALPYTLLLLLAELAVGSLWVTVASDLRGGVTRGFVMTMAFFVAVTAALAWWTAGTIHVGADVDGYRIDADWFGPAKRALLAVLFASFLYTLSVFMGWDPIGRLAGIGGTAAGAVVIAVLAAMLAPPTWGYPAALLGLLSGTFALGAVSTSMVWGHWYLTEGSLPARPLREMAWALIAALAFQTAVVALNLVVPVRETPIPANAVDVDLFANPVLYLRIGVGLGFAIVLGVLSLRTAQIRSMQSATGLLYVCMGAVFVGEVLAKGLMFMTARPL